jgi:hypothetical protein
MKARPALLAAIAVTLLLLPSRAEAGISSIAVHGETYSSSDTIPVFVDSSTKNAIIVKGQFMDLCTGVESTSSSFAASIGRRFIGSNSGVEILVGAGSASDLATSTIKIKFAVGEETFKVKAFKIKVTRFALEGGATTCPRTRDATLVVSGTNMNNLVISVAGAMLDVIEEHVDIKEKLSSSDTEARFKLTCTAEGTFSVRRFWFADGRVPDHPEAKQAMVRGFDTPFVVTVTPTPTKTLN